MTRHRLLRHCLFAVAGLMLVAPACSASGGDEDSKKDSTTTTVADDSTTTTDDSPSTTTEAEETTTTEDQGGDDPSATADEQEYIDALVESFGDPEPFTSEQVECAMSRWVDELGVDRFLEKDVTPDVIRSEDSDPSDLDLSEDEADSLIDQMAGCDMDLRSAIVQSFVQNAEQEPTEDQQSCIDAAIADEDARRLYSLIIRGEYQAANDDATWKAAEACTA